MIGDPVGRAAGRLREAGAGPGRRLALLVEPDPAGAVLILAAARVGGTVSVLNSRWTGPELARVLDLLKPHAMVVGPGVELPGGFRSGLPGGDPLIRWTHPARAREVDPVDPGWSPGRESGRGGGDPAWVLWTSGSTGKPRGIVLSHQAFRASARAVGRRLDLRPGDRWLASLQPAHVGGLALILRASMLRAGALVLPGSFDPEEFSRLLDQESVTHASLVPSQLVAVLDARDDRPFPHRFRGLLLGGAPTPPPLLERALAAGIPVALTYGMTEAASQVATAPPELVRRKPGVVGPPLEGVEIQAGSPEEGPGEIRVRSPSLAAGRFRGPDRAPEPLVGEDGWLSTGDLGVVDEDGHLRVVGRLSGRIISGGVNVDPVEVEGVLAAHPGVSEVAVLGLPDSRWGERVTAVVVPRDAGDPPTLDSLLAHARSRLSAAKRPRGVILVRELPRTATGKVDRRELAAMVGGG